MFGGKTKVVVILLLSLLLASQLVGCGDSEPPPTEPPPATATATEVATDTTFTSPLPEPTSTPVIVQLDPADSPFPTGTPDPSRTAVAIVEAELGPGREVITIQNISTQAQDMGGWILFNLNADEIFRLPEDLALQPGETIQVYSNVPQSEVPEGAFWWTEDEIWKQIPADILLLNRATRLMFWYIAYEE